MTRVLCVIPARMESTRFPGKPLQYIGKRTLIHRAWEQGVATAVFTKVVVATDSEEIRGHIAPYGAAVVMTSSSARTGSDRVAEAQNCLAKAGDTYDIVVNLQGDMPFIRPEVIQGAVLDFERSGAPMGTIATPIADKEEFFRPSCVKVVVNESKGALYFSRAPIPYPRAEPKSIDPESVLTGSSWGLKHVGLYLFKPSTLALLTKLPESMVEAREGLEQLRVLAAGVSIHVTIFPRSMMEPCIEIDTPEDLQRAQEKVAELSL